MQTTLKGTRGGAQNWSQENWFEKSSFISLCPILSKLLNPSEPRFSRTQDEKHPASWVFRMIQLIHAKLFHDP